MVQARRSGDGDRELNIHRCSSFDREYTMGLFYVVPRALTDAVNEAFIFDVKETFNV